ncbi:hypothetical protein [Rhizobium leguminosarum]|uniref:hypothetical protein n=1 Tax=Rhizobium leguminosarum TaxID=384 RepID=UPI002E0D87E0|nr:hypothetical protein U8Q02_39000 [Rhizobium leguminosarum]
MSVEFVGKALRYLLSLAINLTAFTLGALAMAYFFDIELEHFWAALVGVALGDILAPFIKKGLRRLVGSRAA